MKRALLTLAIGLLSTQAHAHRHHPARHYLGYAASTRAAGVHGKAAHFSFHRAGITHRHRAAVNERPSKTAAHSNVATARAHGLPWCGAFMADLVGVSGRLARELWIAANWARLYGHAAPGPAPGVIGVERHHVFRVIAVIGPGRVLAISGNDSHAVRTRVRSTRGVIAWRQA